VEQAWPAPPSIDVKGLQGLLLPLQAAKDQAGDVVLLVGSADEPFDVVSVTSWPTTGNMLLSKAST